MSQKIFVEGELSKEKEIVFTNGLDRIIMSEQNIALLKCFEV